MTRRHGICLALVYVSILPAQVIVPTYHNDNGRTGRNQNEYLLTPDVVASGRFGKRYSRQVDGSVYAQPLYIPGVPVTGKGTRNVLLVATAHDSLYAFDADSNEGTSAEPLWKVSFLDAANNVTSVPAADVGCNVIFPEIGITGTPVVDPDTLTAYVIAETKEPGPSYVYRLHAIDMKTGRPLASSPMRIETAGFKAGSQKQRTGLLLANGSVYSSWSGICDRGSYQGWVFAHDARTLQLRNVFNDSPARTGGSFWNGGAGPSADAQGNVYVVSANGPFDADRGGASYGNSFVKLSPQLAVLDYFSPFNRELLDAADVDVGSSGAVLLPDEAGSAAHPHLVVSAGKEGRIYLLDRDRMGQAQTGSDTGALASLPVFPRSVFGSPAYFNGYLYFAPEYSPLSAFRLSNASLSSSAVSTGKPLTDALGATPSISSNGNTNGIIWISPYTAGGALEAYDAGDVSRLLFTSAGKPVDSLGSWSEFTVPTIADGKVFVAAGNQVAVYGLLNTTAGEILAVANSASFRTGEVAPDSLISLFGSRLALATASATALPLPVSLADVSLRINGSVVPLLYVSPSQINAYVPATVGLGSSTFVVSVAGIPSASLKVQIGARSPGLFTAAGGAAAAIDVNSISIDSRHPAVAGEIVSIFLTGLGKTEDAGLSVTIGGLPAAIRYAGPAPGYVGLSQMNVVVPDLAPGEYPITVSAGSIQSNAALISVTTRQAAFDFLMFRAISVL